MPTQNIALISETNRVDFGLVAQVAAAIQRQLDDDLLRLWGVHGSINPFQSDRDLPKDGGYMPIYINDELSDPRLGGFHRTHKGAPYARVVYSDFNRWTIDASHECLEILVDPTGNEFLIGESLIADQGPVKYLKEICDPCVGRDPAYDVDGFLMSEFYGPRYFDTSTVFGEKYSGHGSIYEPRQILPGGYLVWFHEASNQWFQADRFNGPVNIQKISPPQVEGSMRERIDFLTVPPVAKWRKKEKRRNLAKTAKVSAAYARQFRDHTVLLKNIIKRIK